jgi:hypothetical protein
MRSTRKVELFKLIGAALRQGRLERVGRRYVRTPVRIPLTSA